MVWGIRNAVYSGVLQRLTESGVEVHLLLLRPPASFDQPEHADFTHAASYEALIAPSGQSATGKALLHSVIRSAFNQRNNIASYPIYQRWFERHYTPRERLRSALIHLLGKVSGTPAIFERLCRHVETLYRNNHDLSPVLAQVERLAPDMIWSTVCVSNAEYPYALVARDLGIPIVTSILSFDNLTSRGLLPEYDHYMVWNQGMCDQLLRFYPRVNRSRVTISGTPQFDFHRRPDFLWSRQRTLQRLGLDGQTRYFIYGASHQSLTPAEPELVSRLLQKMQGNEVLRDCWLVVRLHPLEDWQRWDGVRQKFERVLLSPAWDTPPDPDGWTLAKPADQARLVSSLAHAEACLNVASTITLDTAILDRPAIGIEFSGEPDSPREILYEEYEAEHYRPLVESGGFRLAHTWTELLTLMHQAINEPERDRENRARMVARECGSVDGKAGERVTATLLEQLRSRVTR
jgi:hypothetical protein